MKKPENAPRRFASLAEVHQAFGLPKPLHPLLSLVAGGRQSGADGPLPPQPAHVLSFYKISYQPALSGRLRYGQGYYDFAEGGLICAAPGQVVGGAAQETAAAGTCGQVTLLIHPDFLVGYPLAKKIRQYGFFSYAAHEALHVSAQEQELLLALLRTMEAELASRLDEFSQDVLVAQLEVLLTYANRFYKRQFLTRKVVHGDLLLRLEDELAACFRPEHLAERGLPTVQHLAGRLHVSPSYLSDMLRALTGQSAQQHIHDKLIEHAKEQLATTALSVSEVAYALGFGHPQSFSKFFKAKTTLSPLAFRRSFQAA